MQAQQPISDAAFVAAAAALAGAAGLLQYRLSNGKQGINAFLMKEKSQNPFYAKDFKAERRSPPKWLSGFRLPNLDFVEVYGQPNRQPSHGLSGGALRPDLEELYEALDSAIDREDYQAASLISAKIDQAAFEP